MTTYRQNKSLLSVVRRVVSLLPLLLCVVLIKAFNLPSSSSSIHSIKSATYSSTITTLSSAINNVDWGRKTVLALQKELRSRGLSDKGTKTDLIERLESLNTHKDHQQQQQQHQRQPVPKKQRRESNQTKAAASTTNQRTGGGGDNTNGVASSPFQNHTWVDMDSEEARRIENYLKKHKQEADQKKVKKEDSNGQLNSWTRYVPVEEPRETIIDVTSTSTSPSTPVKPSATTTSTEVPNGKTKGNLAESAISAAAKPPNRTTRSWPKSKESRAFLSIDKDDFLTPYDAAVEMSALDNGEDAPDEALPMPEPPAVGAAKALQSEIDGNIQAEIDGDIQAEIDGDIQAEIDGSIQKEVDDDIQAEIDGSSINEASILRSQIEEVEDELAASPNVNGLKDTVEDFNSKMIPPPPTNTKGLAKDATSSERVDPTSESALSQDEPSPFSSPSRKPMESSSSSSSSSSRAPTEDSPVVAEDPLDHLIETMSNNNNNNKEFQLLERLQKRREQEMTVHGDEEEEEEVVLNETISTMVLSDILPPQLYEKLCLETELVKPTLYPVQEKWYQAISSGQEEVVIMNGPTGSGKTLGYILPLLARLIVQPDFETTTTTNVVVEHEEEEPPSNRAKKRGRRGNRRNRRDRLVNEMQKKDMNESTTTTAGNTNTSTKPTILVLVPSKTEATKVGKTFARYHPLRPDNVVAIVYGGGGGVPLAQNQMNMFRNKNVDVVVGVPGRVLEYIMEGTVELSNVQTVVVDEVDAILNSKEEEKEKHSMSAILKMMNNNNNRISGYCCCQKILVTTTTNSSMSKSVLEFCEESILTKKNGKRRIGPVIIPIRPITADASENKEPNGDGASEKEPNGAGEEEALLLVDDTKEKEDKLMVNKRIIEEQADAVVAEVREQITQSTEMDEDHSVKLDEKEKQESTTPTPTSTRRIVVNHWHTATRSSDRAILALDIIASLEPFPPRNGVVIFVDSKAELKAVSSVLALSENVNVITLEEDMSKLERTRLIEQAITDDDDDDDRVMCRLFVTTDLAANDITLPLFDVIFQFGVPRQAANNRDLYDSNRYFDRIQQCTTTITSSSSRDEPTTTMRVVEAILLYDFEDEGRLLPGFQTEMEVERGIILKPRALPSPQRNILETAYEDAKTVISSSSSSATLVVECFQNLIQSELSNLDDNREAELVQRLAVAMAYLVVSNNRSSKRSNGI
eukprot:scaffold4004_cov105-Cylindrotheca_fusiformis.AAC.14